MKRHLILGDEELAIQELQSTLSEKTQPVSTKSEQAGDLKSIVRGVKDEAEIIAITRALEQTNWNRKKAAGILKISYKALLYKIRQYEIQRVGTSISS